MGYSWHEGTWDLISLGSFVAKIPSFVAKGAFFYLETRPSLFLSEGGARGGLSLPATATAVHYHPRTLLVS